MKRGRPSPDDLRVIPLDHAADRLQPPDNLKPNEQKLFREVVANCPANHFGPADVYLLTNFVRVTLLANRAITDLEKARPKERIALTKAMDQLVKAQMALATKLRLTVQSRVDARKLSRAHAQHPRPSYYDFMKQEGWS
jgi:hypothetical protein